jgi:hypothetical protein
VPKYIEVMASLPKTAVGKVFKPALRKMAVARIYSEALAAANINADVEVIDEKARGLVARISRRGDTNVGRIREVLSRFTQPWELAE